MAEVTSGIKAILSYPAVYACFQFLMGGNKARAAFVEEFIRPEPGMRILDVGCGPAGILDFLPEVEYWGFDICQPYIVQAKARFPQRGHFACKQLEAEDLVLLPKFDLVLALGLLHHLDDSRAVELVRLAGEALNPTGRFVSIDPCLDPSQGFLARFLVRNDRGRNVRNRQGYESLVREVFSWQRVEVRHQVWVPYTHCCTECQK